jgi:hypothetical protein
MMMSDVRADFVFLATFSLSQSVFAITLTPTVVASKIKHSKPTNMWTSHVNNDDTIGQFTAALDKDVTSKGDFNSDLDNFCSLYNVIKCPFITYENNSDTIRIFNAMIDISNWRVMLLAMSTLGTKVKGLFLHNCQLTPQHLSDLTPALVKAGTLKSVKIQYSTFETNAGLGEALKNFLTDSTQVEYLSLKGCHLGDAAVSSMLASLSTNFKINSLNLSENDLTDEAVAVAIQGLRLLGTFRAISFANNPITSLGVNSFLNLLVGVPSSPQVDLEIKAQVKLLADKNKAIKDLNKKRKKAGLQEIVEFGLMPECVKVVGGSSILANTNILAVDFVKIELTSEGLESIVGNLSESKGISISEVETRLFFSKLNVREELQERLESYSKNIVIVE